MTSPIDDDRVRHALGNMLVAGQLRRPPLSAMELRQRHERRRFPRVDTKTLVALAAVVVLLVVFLTVQPLHHGGRSSTLTTTPSVPSGWIAHSAYGLQIATPRAWSVQVFGQCPNGSKPGTLFIGTSQFVDLCPEYGSNTTQVDMIKTDASSSGSARSTGPTHVIWVHGLSVTSSQTDAGVRWVIPSKQVTITGSGPEALSIMQSLAPATRAASPTTGLVTGTEYVEAIIQVPVSGRVTVSEGDGAFPVASVHGHFSFAALPGRYVLTGQAGNAFCPSVSVTVISGERTTAPPIRCQGD
jgi:hypothetical protein